MDLRVISKLLMLKENLQKLSSYFWSYHGHWELFYKIFEGDMLAVFWLTFLLESFYKIHFFLRDLIKIVRLILAAACIYGFEHFLMEN